MAAAPAGRGCAVHPRSMAGINRTETGRPR
jgi:hypothetical protein